TFRKNNFGGRDKILTVDAFASTIDYGPFDARTVSLVGNYERVSTIQFQKPFSWPVGLELVATGEREADADGNVVPSQTDFIRAVPHNAQCDPSDDLLDPRRGFLISSRLSPEVSRTNGVERFFLRCEVLGSYYLPVSDNIVIASRA